MRKEYFKRIKDAAQYIDDLISTYDCGNLYKNYAVHNRQEQICFNWEGIEQDELFKENLGLLSFVPYESVGQNQRKADGRNPVIHRGPINLALPHPMTVYNFRNSRDDSGELCRKMMELGRISQ